MTTSSPSLSASSSARSARHPVPLAAALRAEDPRPTAALPLRQGPAAPSATPQFRHDETLATSRDVRATPWLVHTVAVDPSTELPPTAEHARLAESPGMTGAWRLWGPYLAGRQWGTVREDYSADGNAWSSFPFDQARARAYRWGEDGLGGISDRFGFLNFAVALWNGKDPILKERLFGLTNDEGNHGEDAKEYWWAVDGTPTHSWMQWLYRYPQAEFPYAAAARARTPARPRRAGVRARRHRHPRRATSSSTS